MKQQQQPPKTKKPLTRPEKRIIQIPRGRALVSGEPNEPPREQPFLH